jgi:3-hydroxyacyl-[acyl-carrier-protein] dehydratase
MGHFPDFAIMPGTSIIETIGQSASILFSHTLTRHGRKRIHGVDRRKRHEVPGATPWTIEVKIIKMTDEAALFEGVDSVEDTVVMGSKLSFVRKIV